MSASNVTEYAAVGHGRWAEFAKDLVRVPGRAWWVSAADVADARERGAVRVPMRDAKGRRLSARYDEIKTERARKAFAERMAWPFVLHLANLDTGN